MEEKKPINWSKTFKGIAAATTLISCFRVIIINSHNSSRFSYTDVAEVAIETHQVVQIGVAAILFAVALWIIAEVNKENEQKE